MVKRPCRPRAPDIRNGNSLSPPQKQNHRRWSKQCCERCLACASCKLFHEPLQSHVWRQREKCVCVCVCIKCVGDSLVIDSLAPEFSLRGLPKPPPTSVVISIITYIHPLLHHCVFLPGKEHVFPNRWTVSLSLKGLGYIPTHPRGGHRAGQAIGYCFVIIIFIHFIW